MAYDIAIYPTYYGDLFDARNARIVHRGWCPALVRRYQMTLPVSVLSYIDAAGLVNHCRGHEACDERVCARNDIQIGTYKYQYVDHQCTCAKLKPDIKQIASKIELGVIPLVRLIADDNRDSLTIDHYDPTSTQPAVYAAISHCWLDGLGSSSEEGLYLCQLRRIGGFAGGAFWIDSLCIPRH